MKNKIVERTCKEGNIWDLFHRVWGMTKDSKDYDKAILMRLEQQISDLQTKIEELQEAIDAIR